MFLSSVHPPSVENVPAMANTIPGLREKCSASRRNRVHHQPGTPFGFNPESCSASSRNGVRLAPDSPQQGIECNAGASDLCFHGVVLPESFVAIATLYLIKRELNQESQEKCGFCGAARFPKTLMFTSIQIG